MYKDKVYPWSEKESEMWSARPKKSKFVRLGRRPHDSRLVTEKNLVAEYRVMSELAAMKKCLPAFVTIEFPSEFLDWRRFDVVIRLVGEITRSEYYGGRKYRFEFRITEEYPVEPPLVECVTPAFHPNISSYDGSVGLRMMLEDYEDLLDRGWKRVGGRMIELSEVEPKYSVYRLWQSASH